MADVEVDDVAIGAICAVPVAGTDEVVVAVEVAVNVIVAGVGPLVVVAAILVGRVTPLVVVAAGGVAMTGSPARSLSRRSFCSCFLR